MEFSDRAQDHLGRLGSERVSRLVVTGHGLDRCGGPAPSEFVWPSSSGLCCC